MTLLAKRGVDISRYDLEERVVRRTLPVNIKRGDEALFAGSLDAIIPSPKVEVINDVRINSNGVLFQGNRILLESFSRPENFQNWKLRSVLKVYAESLLAANETDENNVVWAVDDWSGGYYHWLADVLPKLIVASGCPALLLIPSSFKNLGFIEPSLRVLGVTNFRFMGDQEAVECGRLFLPVHTYYSHDFNEQVMLELRGRLRGAVADRVRPNVGRIFISRRNGRKRRIVNEEELFPILEAMGFKIVETEKLTFLEQLELFASTKYLASIHGAGLTNMLFMPPRSRVLELRLRDSRGTNCFFNLASALEHDFYYQFCEPVKPGSHPHGADLIVDVDEFRDTMELFVNG